MTTACRVPVTKPVGKPDAGNPHVRFDERGGETELSSLDQVTAPLLDSTFRKEHAFLYCLDSAGNLYGQGPLTSQFKGFLLLFSKKKAFLHLLTKKKADSSRLIYAFRPVRPGRAR